MPYRLSSGKCYSTDLDAHDYLLCFRVGYWQMLTVLPGCFQT